MLQVGHLRCLAFYIFWYVVYRQKEAQVKINFGSTSFAQKYSNSIADHERPSLGANQKSI